MKTAADPEMASIAVGRLSAVGSRAQWLQRVSVIGRLGWGVADQAVSSLTNVAVSLLLVRVLAPAQFGAYGLAYITYGFALSASRGIFNGTADGAVQRREASRCGGMPSPAARRPPS